MKKAIFSTLLLLSCSFVMQAQESFLTLVPTPAGYAESIREDIYIRPSRATASSSNRGEELDKAIDGDMSTIYHSSYNGMYGPVTLDFFFDNQAIEQLDYIVYNPRTSGSNGNFKEIEVQYSIKDDDVAPFKYRDYDFGGSSMPSIIFFDEPLRDVDQIRIIVKSGAGEGGRQFASCAEMQFYRKNPNNFDYATLFTDPSCSELKPDVTLDNIKQETNDFFRKLALDIYRDYYEPEFRVQEYQAYPEPTTLAQINKIARYGILDNPTGIYATRGEDIIVLVGNTDFFPSLAILTPGGRGERSVFSLRKGVNKIHAPHDGLMYILFHTLTGKEPPVKINIVTGTVNGYFDRDKHTANDWQRLLAQATFPYFDLKGKYAMMCFETAAYRDYCPNNGLEVIKSYDDLVYWEQEFQGMVKYNTLNQTRMVLLTGVMAPGVAAYASDYWTVYGSGSQEDLLDLSKLKSISSTVGGGAWMPAHEIGHVNQTRPGLKWLGMTEVTNNILSQYITIKWGVRSRLNDENIGGGKNRYQAATEEIVKAELPHNQHGDVFFKLVPFWQLKLYMMDVLDKEDFYKDVYQKVRTNPDPVKSAKGSTLDGMCQLEFVKIVCEVSELDMTEFFTDWGFLRPVSLTVSDYATNPFIVKQEDIDAVKAEIAAMNLPKPPVPAGKHIYEITDKNWQEFRP
ncbi:MAG: M60 family metallopeptidase [Dysgonamonadaceae bacterium]|jgi:hypothetical protein|nr:M60 family metallopeptidase [Dysgonamonadaceae bacterium]